MSSPSRRTSALEAPINFSAGAPIVTWAYSTRVIHDLLDTKEQIIKNKFLKFFIHIKKLYTLGHDYLIKCLTELRNSLYRTDDVIDAKLK